MATETITHNQIITLMLELHEQVLGSISDSRIEHKGDIQRLEHRMSGVEERLGGVDEKLKQVRRTQIEDSTSFGSIYVNHERRLKKLERWRAPV